METRNDHYATLGVARDAEDLVIRAAYKALSQRYHPDKCAPGDRPSAHRRMAEINAAFHVLGDAALRRAYDEQHPYTTGETAHVSAEATDRAAALRRFAPLGIIVCTVFVALQFAVEKKGWWTFTWEFMTNGLHRPSTYSINWLLLTAIMCAGLRVAWVVHRRLTKR